MSSELIGILTVGVALAALILATLRGMRTELRGDSARVRDELHGVRDELRGDIRTLDHRMQTLRLHDRRLNACGVPACPFPQACVDRLTDAFTSSGRRTGSGAAAGRGRRFLRRLRSPYQAAVLRRRRHPRAVDRQSAKRPDRVVRRAGSGQEPTSQQSCSEQLFDHIIRGLCVVGHFQPPACWSSAAPARRVGALPSIHSSRYVATAQHADRRWLRGDGHSTTRERPAALASARP